MRERTILIFPDFENREQIDRWRTQYDPLAKLIRPHITVVFPFRSEMTDREVEKAIVRALADVAAFDVTLEGVHRQSDRFGHTLMLPVTEGAGMIRAINRRLYKDEFRNFDLGLPYLPHVTLGAFDSREDLDRAYEAVKCGNLHFVAKVTEVCAERIGEQGESIIIARVKI